MNKKDIKDIYELSPMQQGMLFHSLAAPESGAYIIRISHILKGDLDVPAFERAWQRVVDRHPVFRSSFHSEDFDKPLQVVHRQAKLSLEQQDWREFTLAEQGEHLDAYFREEGRRGFNLTEVPLMRLALFRCADDTYQFVISQHHILMDGWCRPLIFKEASTFYEAFCRGENIQLELPHPYRDYIVWLQQQDMISAEAFWRDELKGFSSLNPLVVNRRPGNLPTREDDFDKQSLRLSKAITDAIKTLARRHSLTLNTMVQGLWALFLSRYSGEEDVVFGATVSGRPPDLIGVESMIGLFINTLPVRVRVRPEAQLMDWLKDIQAHQTLVRQYEYSPLVNIQQWSEVPHALSLFDSILVFEDFPGGTADEVFGSLDMHLDCYFDFTNYPLTVEVVPGSELLFQILYDCRLFDDATITRMLAHLKTLLEGMVDDHMSRLSDLPILTEQERHQLVVEWNDTNIDYPMDQCLHELFEAQVERSPEAIAVVFEDEQVSYRELNRRANQLAHHLRTLGVGPEALVGICIERSVEMVVGLFGILKAGGAYVPIDPAYPQERMAFMLADAQVIALLTQKKFLGKIPEFDKPVICLDSGWKDIAGENDNNPHNSISADNLAYVIYTSGSTGKPKGVMIEHRGICNRLLWMQDAFRLTASDRVLQKTTFCFDVSVWEFFWPLITGAALVVARPDGHKDSNYLVNLIESRKITTIHFVPSMLQLFLEADNSNCCSLKRVICSGEALPLELEKRFFNKMTSELYNLYGPTEASVDVTFYQCSRDSQSHTVPIGHPIANTQIYILDSYLQPVPIGVSGDLYIGGVGLARGYLNRSELTSQVFIPNPFSGKRGERLYKTGDVARFLPDGNIDFLGRIDHQVKIRGNRIELGEIETALMQHKIVNEAVAIVRNDGDDKRLVAYIVPVTGETPVQPELREFLREKLPEYMIPSVFVTIDKLPLTSNGKVNRSALPAPQYTQISDSFSAPQTETELTLAKIMEDVLQIDRVGRLDNFFNIGGHSLLAMKVVDRFEKATGVRMEVGELFQQTVGQIAAWNEKKISKQTGKIKGKLNTVLNKLFTLGNQSKKTNY